MTLYLTDTCRLVQLYVDAVVKCNNYNSRSMTSGEFPESLIIMERTLKQRMSVKLPEVIRRETKKSKFKIFEILFIYLFI